MDRVSIDPKGEESVRVVVIMTSPCDVVVVVDHVLALGECRSSVNVSPLWANR